MKKMKMYVRSLHNKIKKIEIFFILLFIPIKKEESNLKKMKTETMQIGNKKITFFIGNSSADNFAVIDIADGNDIWFHLNNVSSCHVVASLKDHEVADKKELHKIVVAGACLCKKHSSKYSSISNLEILYTRVKFVVKTEVVGSVLTTNTKIIRV